MKFIEGFMGWLISVAISLCVVIAGVVWSEIKLEPREAWLLAILAGTISWVFILVSRRPARNRYRLRTRVMRWLEQQFPLLPTG